MRSKEAERKRQKLYLKYLKRGACLYILFQKPIQVITENLFLAMDEKQKQFENLENKRKSLKQ